MKDYNIKCRYDIYVEKFKKFDCKIITTIDEYIELGKTVKSINKIKVDYIAKCGHINNILTQSFLDRQNGIYCIDCLVYNRYKQVCVDNNCKLITPIEDFIEIKKSIDDIEKIKIEYIASCGHKNYIYVKSLKLNCGLICRECSNKINHAVNIDGSSRGTSTEDDSILYLKKLLQHNFEIKLTDDGCLADFAIRNINITEDKWSMVQVKSSSVTNKNHYSFHLDDRYKNCICICISLTDKKIWILNGNEVTNKVGIAISKTKSKYDKNKINGDLVDKINELIKILPVYKFNDINIPVSPTQKIEQEFRIHRESMCDFINYEYPDKTALVYDFTVNNLKFQEKVIGKIKTCKNSYLVNLGRTKYKVYKKGDNDFYWFHFPDKIKFMLLPEQILESYECIKSDTCDGKHYFAFNTLKNQELEQYMFSYDTFTKQQFETLISHK